jgi:DNA-binding HxlR family transcriptional regulator
MATVIRNVHTYDHFCPAARTLELVGDRWTLLVIRDLLTGPKRFTDLGERLAGITPKTLIQRLRELEGEGLIASDREPGRREARYRLTDAGQDLAPVVDALRWWGLRHAWRWPRSGEPLHAEHLLASVAQAIDNMANDRGTDDRAPARWHFRFPGDDYLLTGDGGRWSLTETADAADPRAPADVTVTATVEAFTKALVAPAPAAESGVDIVGRPDAVRRFERLIHAMADLVGVPETKAEGVR